MMNPDQHPLSQTNSTHPHSNQLNPQSNIITDYPLQSPLQQSLSTTTHSTITLLPPSPISTTSPSSSSSNHSNHSSPTNSTNTTTPHHQLLNHFSNQCQKMFYEADQNATKSVEQIIKQLPAASKATFTKQMTTIRSQFHRDSANSRRAKVDQLLLETLPSSLIIKSIGHDSSLNALRSPRARQERKDRLKKFILAHCLRNMVGVHPFFSSLCAVLHLLIIPARKGGSGKRRIEWDIDLALFCEAGGEPFLRDSIEFLKGVLGFEDHLKALTAPSFVSSRMFDPDEDEDIPPDMIIGHSDGDDGLTLEERQELEVDEEENESSTIDVRNEGRRRPEDEEGPFADSSSPSIEDDELVSSRKGKEVLFKRRGTEESFGSGQDQTNSDPFLDPCPTTHHNSPRITVSPAIEDHQMMMGLGLINHNQNHSSGSTTPKALHSSPLNSSTIGLPIHKRSPTQNSLDQPPPTEIRTFRSPSYLSNPEIKDLIECFPEFIRIKCKTIRLNQNSTFSNKSNQNGKLGIHNGGEGNKVGEIELEKMKKMQGHGIIKVSVFERDENWKGSLLDRIKVFFFRLFGI